MCLNENINILTLCFFLLFQIRGAFLFCSVNSTLPSLTEFDGSLSKVTKQNRCYGLNLNNVGM